MKLLPKISGTGRHLVVLGLALGAATALVAVVAKRTDIDRLPTPLPLVCMLILYIGISWTLPCIGLGVCIWLVEGIVRWKKNR